MELTAPPIQLLPVLASALLAAVIGLFATLRRGHSCDLALRNQIFRSTQPSWQEAWILGFLCSRSGAS